MYDEERFATIDDRCQFCSEVFQPPWYGDYCQTVPNIKVPICGYCAKRIYEALKKEFGENQSRPGMVPYDTK